MGHILTQKITSKFHLNLSSALPQGTFGNVFGAPSGHPKLVRFYPQKISKNSIFWSKTAQNGAPPKSGDFHEIFPFSRKTRKSGGLAGNFGRSGRAHRCFWGHFYQFSPDFPVNLLLKGFVPKNLKIAKTLKKWPPDRIFREKSCPEAIFWGSWRFSGGSGINPFYLTFFLKKGEI